jgi:cobalt/nickel transport system permease protein
VSGLCEHRPALAGVAGDPSSRLHRLDPRAKLLVLFTVTVVAVSAPLEAWPVYAGCALVLASVAVAARVGPGTIWRRARVVLPLVLLVAVFVPFVRTGGATYSLGPLSVSGAGLAVLATVAAKATIGTVSAVLLGATTSFPDVLRALESLHVPRLFVQIAAFMFRYLVVIADEVQRLRAALAARGYRPRHALRAGAIGRAAGALFVRSYARGERVYLAMLARGYGGTMPRYTALAFGRADALAVAGAAGFLLALRLAVEL